jgi:microcystin-dependent protein
MVTNDFVPFATGVGANVEAQATYLTDPQTAAGQQPGIARSAINNKAIRQATSIAAALAQYMANQTGNNVLDDGNQSELLATMALAFSANPSGSITMWGGGATAPTGYLICDGSAVSRTTYAHLFAAIGTANGVGDGSSTFNLPDFRGMFPRGVTGSSSNDPDASSRTAVNGGNSANNVGSVQASAFEAHSHEVAQSSGLTSQNLNSAAGVMGESGPSGGYTATCASGQVIQNTGGDETRPINIYVYFIIKI